LYDQGCFCIGKVVDQRFRQGDEWFSLIVLIDSMAEKYGMLPTEVLERASTQDVVIHWNVEQHKDIQRQKASGKPVDYNSQYTQEELKDIWQKSRSK